jgi:prephenate dehydrogenase
MSSFRSLILFQRAGVIGFGRFGQFISKTFAKYGQVVVTSRSDYTELAAAMGVTYIPLSHPKTFLDQHLDVVVICVSITSFRDTVRQFVPFLNEYVATERQRGGLQHNAPLIVDVLSVKEHARQILLEELPLECDILCTHPMFGPDSGRNGWKGLNFVYEKTRIDQCVLDPERSANSGEAFIDVTGQQHSVHEDSEAHVEGMDRMERFLSIWEEEGCRMVPMSCRDHDAYAANSQFLTHLIGRVLGQQGLGETPIDTSGFQSVLKLVQTTNADSFDLFYGLYKYNQKNSISTIKQLQSAMDDVVANLHAREQEELTESIKSQLSS